MRKSKLLFTIIGMFLLLGTINVKAYDVSSLTGSDYTITIDKFQMNLYPVVEQTTGNTISLFKDPITFDIPMGAEQFQITGDNLIEKQLKNGENTYQKLKLIELQNNFTEKKISEFIETQSFDKTKKYYGDITVTYTVSAFPATYKTFTQINGLRTGLSLLTTESSEALGIDLSEIENPFDFGKSPYVTQSLTSGTSFSSTQSLNLFYYNNNDDEGTTEVTDKLDYSNDYSGDAVENGINAFDYGLFSEESSFSITKTNASDQAIMFSIVQGMGDYIDSINIASIGDDYIGDIIDDGDGDLLGTQIVKVGNTAAAKNELLIISGLILVFSGLLVFYNVFRKRYN